MDTWRNDNVIMTSKRRFDVIMTLLLRCVSTGLYLSQQIENSTFILNSKTIKDTGVGLLCCVHCWLVQERRIPIANALELWLSWCCCMYVWGLLKLCSSTSTFKALISFEPPPCLTDVTAAKLRRLLATNQIRMQFSIRNQCFDNSERSVK